MHVARYLFQIVVSIGLTLALQLWDRSRLSPQRRARVWNFASWACALYAFGPLSMLGWFWVTRRLRGIPLAIGSILLLTFLITLADSAFVWAVGLPLDSPGLF